MKKLCLLAGAAAFCACAPEGMNNWDLYRESQVRVDASQLYDPAHIARAGEGEGPYQRARLGDRERLATIVGTDETFIVVETPSKQQLRLVPGYQTRLSIEGRNLNRIQQVRLLQNGAPLPDVTASLRRTSSTKGIIEIDVPAGVRAEGPLQLQMVGAEGRAPLPIEIEIREGERVRR